MKDGQLELSDLSNERIKDELRERTFSDEGLFFVSRYMIGNHRLTEKVHKPPLVWLQKQVSTPDCLFAYRDPRMSGKTDGFTIALGPWAWATKPIPNSPIQGVDTCIVVVAPKKDLASYIFVANVEERLERSEVYRELYPWVKPDPRYWSRKNGLRLQRSIMHGLPSLMPLGMESVSTSLHPPILICDDPIHEQNYRSATEIRRVRDWVQHSHALTGPVHGVRGFIGNHWCVGDVQDLFHPEREDCQEEFKNVQVWERGITGCHTCVNGRAPEHVHEGPLFPIALGKIEMNLNAWGPDIPEPVTYIDEVAKSKATFIYLTQHENKLIDPANLQFEKQWLKTWNWFTMADGSLAIDIGSPVQRAAEAIRAGSPYHENRHRWGGTREVIPLHMLDFYILVDPAPSEEFKIGRSRFAIAVLAVEKAGPRHFLIEEYASNAPSHTNIGQILDYWVKWRPHMRRIGVESVAYQATIKDALLVAATGREIILRESDIEMLTRLRSEGQQEDRIKYALVPILESGNFFINPMHRLFRGEYDVFGLKNAQHDLLDAISNINRVRTPTRTRSRAPAAAAARARERLSKLGATGH